MVSTDNPDQLESTGERYLPETMAGVIELEHLHRYAIARELAFGKEVLDIACGEGYGADLLASVARSVTGVDIAEEAVAFATAKYQRKNLRFLCGSAAMIPLLDASVDLVVSFETIEHHDEHCAMLAEIRRVLRPDGVLVISSPDKHEYSDVPGYRNPYHVRELFLSEFEGLLMAEFTHVRIFGQRVCYGSLVAPLGEEIAAFATFTQSDVAIRRDDGIVRPLYFVAVASNSALPPFPAAFYDGSRALDGQLAKPDPELSRLFPGLFRRFDEHVAEVTRLTDHGRAQDVEVTRLLGEVAARDTEVARLGGEIAARDGEIGRLVAEVTERDLRAKSLRTRSAEIARLLAEERVSRQNDVDALRTEIEHQQLHNDQLSAGLDAMRESTCWRLTAPVRLFKITASNVKLRRRLRSVAAVAARTLYRVLPVPPGTKVALKGRLFSSFPFLFRRTAAYQAWEVFTRDREAPPPMAPNEETSPTASMPVAACGSREKSFIDELYSDSSTDYVPHSDGPPPVKCVRAVAFYLPQFHPIPENDRWWGRGFTEWRNVGRAKPEFLGHYQPRLPGELGYYDLRVPAVQERQVELAKAYGVDAFCFYFYWFGGRILLDLPLRQYLDRPELDLSFCICWANENWTRTWDGLESDVLIAQDHSPEDDTAFIERVSSYMRDPRYLKIGDKPLLLVYRPSLLPDAKQTAERWRGFCRDAGIGEIFLAYTQSFDSVDPAVYGFDAAVEFPPNNSSPPVITGSVVPVNPCYQGTVYDWRVFVQRSRDYADAPYPLFRGVCPSWDNDARKPGRGTILLHSSPAGYREWLFNAAIETARRVPIFEERLIFINAWNEWAEGAYLEPDQRYGYAYLEATRKALQLSTLALSEQPVKCEARGESTSAPHGSTPRLWVVIHAYFPELLEEIFARLSQWTMPHAIMLTVPQERYEAVSDQITRHKVVGECLVCENRGRDILPFLQAARMLRGRGAEVILKLHTKKSVHRVDGDAWRGDLVAKLLAPEVPVRILADFEADPNLGLVGPSGHVASLDYFWKDNERIVRRIMGSLGVTNLTPEKERFVAGSMFYARLGALRPLLDLPIAARDFEPERGQVDGTLAHAIERCFTLVCGSAGYSWSETDRMHASGVATSALECRAG